MKLLVHFYWGFDYCPVTDSVYCLGRRTYILNITKAHDNLLLLKYILSCLASSIAVLSCGPEL